MSVLSIKGLHASVDDREILCGLDLEVDAGEVHAIMGPNGSGKSTLSYVLAGREGYEVTAGSVSYQGHDLLASAPSWDGKWLSALLRAAGLPRHSLRLRDSDEAMREIDCDGSGEIDKKEFTAWFSKIGEEEEGGLDPEEPDPCEEGAPGWIVTFGDMMALLLCFFMLDLQDAFARQN